MARKRKAGHRSWAARSEKVPGSHAGDTMAKETRSRVMSRIKGKNTSPEVSMAEELCRRGETSFERHASDLPGRPDFVFRPEGVVVFVDGDFWHGYRFPLWKHKLSPKWQEKIQATRERDKRTFRRIRKLGWIVIRIWEHQIERDLPLCGAKVLAALRAKRAIN